VLETRLTTYCAIAAALFAAAILLAIVSGALDGSARARAAGSTPDIYIEVAGEPACTTNNPSDPPDTIGEAACDVPLGEQFTLGGYVGSITGLPDTDADPGYSGVQWRILHSVGLTLNNPSGTDAELGFPVPFWPDCTGSRSDAEATGQYDIICQTSGGDESTFTGKIIAITYTCSLPGQNVITQNDAASYVRNESDTNQPIDKHGTELLTINCVDGPTSTPSQTPPPTPTPTPKNPLADTDGDTIANDTDSDDDNDGCPDAREVSGTESSGGLRNPHVFWDFFDTPDPDTNDRDQAVAGTDFFRVLARFGSTGSTAIDPLSMPPPPPAYHTAYDRGPPAPGQQVWDLTSPNGSIAGTDFFSILAQFGHNCA
jgi:hypothetical protein